MSRDAERDVERDVDIFIVCRVKPDRHQADMRQAPPLAYTPCQRFKASCASYADGSLRLLCASECISGFHEADDLSQSSPMVWHLTT